MARRTPKPFNSIKKALGNLERGYMRVYEAWLEIEKKPGPELRQTCRRVASTGWRFTAASHTEMRRVLGEHTRWIASQDQDLQDDIARMEQRANEALHAAEEYWGRVEAACAA
jgi:hypothetical protein